ncbi:hypothetical protein QEG73_01225 [Chitinophagaceae bacterium 26-R-25]|nr:hypothetical protein [Chitinophagaceae bacterium 26-R-25]
MLRLFKRRNRVLVLSQPVLNEVAMRIRKCLGHASIWLQKQTATWSKLEWYTVIIVFCVGSLLVCSSIVKEAIVHPGGIFSHEVHIRPIQHFRPEPITVDPAEILNTLIADKKFLDSLRIHDSLQFEAMLKINPAVVDSLDALIHLYQAQLK